MATAGRPQVNQKQYLGPETVFGLPLAADTAFPSLMLNIASEFKNQPYRPMGKVVPMSSVKHREYAKGSYEGGLDYNEIIYPLASMFGAPTPTVLSGAANEWVFAPLNSNFGTPKSFTERMGDAIASRVTPGVLFNGMDVNVTQDEAKISGPLLAYATNESAGPIGATTDEVQQLTITGTPTGGTFTLTYSGQTTGAIAYNATAAVVQAALVALSNIADGDVFCYGGPLPGNAINVHFAATLGATNVGAITTTDSLTGGSTPATAILTPAAGAAAYADIAQQPVSVSEQNVYFDSTFAAIGTTQYCDAVEAYVTIPELREPDFRLCRDVESFVSGVIKALENGGARLALSKSPAVITLRAALNQKARPTYYLRYEFVGATITGAYTYKLLIDMAVQLKTAIDKKDLNGAVYGHELDLQLVGSTTMLGPIKITVWNTVAAL